MNTSLSRIKRILAVNFDLRKYSDLHLLLVYVPLYLVSLVVAVMCWVKTVCTQNMKICRRGGGEVVQILHFKYKFNTNIFILCTYHPHTHLCRRMEWKE